AGQDVYGLVGEAISVHGRLRPGLPCSVFSRIVEVLGMVKKIGGHQRHHIRKTTPVVSQIKDKPIRAVQSSHRSRGGCPAYRYVRKRIEFEIADIVREHLYFLERAVLLLHRGAIAGE